MTDDLPDEERDEIRLRSAIKAVKPVPKKPTQAWATRALLASILCKNPSLQGAAIYVVLVGGLDDTLRTEASTWLPGKSVWRLLYEWDEAQGSMDLTPAQFRDEVLDRWAGMGEVLRARVRYEQKFGRKKT